MLTTVPSLSLYTPGAIKDSSSDANKPSQIMLFSGAMAVEDKTHCACVCVLSIQLWLASAAAAALLLLLGSQLVGTGNCRDTVE